MNLYRKHTYLAFLYITGLIILISCATTKQSAIPQAWTEPIAWQNFTSAELIGDSYAIVQSETDLVILDGKKGARIVNEIEEQGGLLSAFGNSIKESVQNPLSADNKVEVKYWHTYLPTSNTLLLFNRVEDTGPIRAINLDTGTERWSTTQMPWNIEEYRDEAGIAVDMVARQSIGAAMGASAASEMLLQTRAIAHMIEEVPAKNAFLFKTVDGQLQLVESESGDIIWQTDQVSSSGLAGVTYLEFTDELLIAGDMAGLKDIIKSTDDQETMKQLYLLDAATGEIKWSAKYQGRDDLVSEIRKAGENVRLYFDGGSAEIFAYNDGQRLFGTRDEGLMGATRTASATTNYNTMETPETAIPKFEGEFVYAVNPSDVGGMSLPDKKLSKFNYKTGELIWESAPLEKTPDVRDMLLLEDRVLVRVSMNTPDVGSGKKGNIVGGTNDLGIYAFDKETGEQVWSYTGPFGDNIANVLYEESTALTAGGNTIYKFGLSSGDELQSLTLEEPDMGTIFMIDELNPNNLLVSAQNGMAVVQKDNLTVEYTKEFDGRLQSYELKDRYYITKSSKLLSEKEMLYSFDLSVNRLVTDFNLAKPEKSLFGDLDNRGYALIDNNQLLTITPVGFTSYRLQ